MSTDREAYARQDGFHLRYYESARHYWDAELDTDFARLRRVPSEGVSGAVERLVQLDAPQQSQVVQALLRIFHPRGCVLAGDFPLAGDKRSQAVFWSDGSVHYTRDRVADWAACRRVFDSALSACPHFGDVVRGGPAWRRRYHCGWRLDTYLEFTASTAKVQMWHRLYDDRDTEVRLSNLRDWLGLGSVGEWQLDDVSAALRAGEHAVASATRFFGSLPYLIDGDIGARPTDWAIF